MERTSPVSYLKDSRFRFSALLWFALVVFPLGVKSITNIALLLVVLHSLVFLKGRDWRQALHSNIFLFSAAFFIMYALSLLWTEDIDQGLKQLETKSSFLLAPLFIVAARNRYMPQFRNTALHAILIGNVLAALLALSFAALRAIEQGGWFRPVPGGGKQYFFLYTHLAEPVMHPGYFATFLGFGCFIALYFLLLKDIKQKLLYLILLGFFFFMMVLLQGRINLLALVFVLGAGTLVYAIRQKAYKWLVLPALPVLLFIGLLLFGPATIKERYFQLPDFSYDISGREFNSATYRLAEWSSALDVLAEHPWVGAGIGDGRQALINAYQENRFWVGMEERYNAHNQYLETALSVGLIGLLLLLVLCGYYGLLSIKRKDYLSLSLLLFFMVSMLTESMLERSWAVILFNSYFPLLLCLPRNETLNDTV